MPKTKLPLVYSCSGCSNVAQLANDLALRAAREGRAEMSCAVGVGGGVKPLVRAAQSGRPILALDGCPLECVRHCLERVGVEPTRHIELSLHGLRKLKSGQYAPEQADALYPVVVGALDELQPAG